MHNSKAERAFQDLTQTKAVYPEAKPDIQYFIEMDHYWHME